MGKPNPELVLMQHFHQISHKYRQIIIIIIITVVNGFWCPMLYERLSHPVEYKILGGGN